MIRPLNDRVIVKLDDERGVSQEGIILLGHDTIRTGTVIRAGRGRHFTDKFLHMEVVPGDRVAFIQATMETKSEEQLQYHLDDDHGFITERDILFVIEEGNPRISK